jgi:catechol 2,3-dioxygenase-like lactoylglutathione lyase family enzyme
MQMKTLGLRHLALRVRDPQKSKEFYTRVLKMQVEWEPDPQNVYLTSGGQDNLALHQTDEVGSSDSRLDHLGFILTSADEVDTWYAWMKTQNVKVVNEVKTHRDGARSFYVEDPDGIVIQMIYHPPIVASKNSNHSV